MQAFNNFWTIPRVGVELGFGTGAQDWPLLSFTRAMQVFKGQTIILGLRIVKCVTLSAHSFIYFAWLIITFEFVYICGGTAGSMDRLIRGGFLLSNFRACLKGTNQVYCTHTHTCKYVYIYIFHTLSCSYTLSRLACKSNSMSY